MGKTYRMNTGSRVAGRDNRCLESRRENNRMIWTVLGRLDKDRCRGFGKRQEEERGRQTGVELVVEMKSDTQSETKYQDHSQSPP